MFQLPYRISDIDRPPRSGGTSAAPGRRLIVAGLLAGSVTALPGCFPLALSGAAVGTMAVLDRRTLGAQTEDQSIELKSLRELNRVFANGEASVSVTSFNRRVLLSGQAASEQEKKRAEETVRVASPNIRDIYNEIEVGSASDFARRTRDTGLTARVKAALVRERDLPANAVKVVSEDSTVFLMGLVTQDEGDRAAHLAARASGATRVVTLFEYLTPQELVRIQQAPQGK